MRVFDQVFDSLKHLEYVENALKTIDRKLVLIGNSKLNINY